MPLAGVVPVVWTDDDIPAGSVAIDTGTRELPPADAAARVARLARHLHREGIAFKKIDSLLRGHVAAELQACRGGFDRVVLAPAFPYQGRITRGGRQFAGGRDVGVDPASLPVPMRDAETDADLVAIVVSESRRSGRVLWCGTAGLAGALAGGRPVPRPHLPGSIALLIGSDHAVTCEQLATIAPRVAPHAESIVVTVNIPPATPRAIARDQICRRLVQWLSQVTRPGTLFVTGGETLRGVCIALGVGRLDVDGEWEPGVPTSVMRGGDWDGQRVVSRSGAFGDPEFLARLAGGPVRRVTL